MTDCDCVWLIRRDHNHEQYLAQIKERMWRMFKNEKGIDRRNEKRAEEVRTVA